MVLVTIPSHMRFTKGTFLVVFIGLSITVYSQGTIALDHTHAHNDYKHKHPLSDALNYGFISVEADVFLKGNNFIVAHFTPLFKKKKTLEALYLKPLSDLVNKNSGRIYSDYKVPVILLIDIKTNATETYKALKPLLDKYSFMLSECENGKFIERPVMIILSGNKPYDMISDEVKRFAFIDENLMTMQTNNFSLNYSPLASTKYSNIITWKGKGKIPENEKHNLQILVEAAHSQGKKVRLWASPENRAVWDELLDDGVDLIGTDQLKELNQFIVERKKVSRE
jgi:hypothetical protein